MSLVDCAMLFLTLAAIGFLSLLAGLTSLVALVLLVSAISKPVGAAAASVVEPVRSGSAKNAAKAEDETTERTNCASERATAATTTPSAASAPIVSCHRTNPTATAAHPTAAAVTDSVNETDYASDSDSDAFSIGWDAEYDSDSDCATSAVPVSAHRANPVAGNAGTDKDIDIDTGFNYGSICSDAAYPVVSNVDSTKEIDIDTGINYGWAAKRANSVCSSLNDSSPDLDNEDMSFADFDEDDSFFLNSEADSQFFQSGDLDVDWELESIASVASSLNDTDFILGGESYDSDEESDSDEDLYLRGWSSDLDSVCSSLNDTDYILGGESYDSDAECGSDSIVAPECSSLNDTDYILGGEVDDSDCESESESDVCSVMPICAEMVEQDVASVFSSKPIDDDQSTEEETDEEEELESETEQPAVSASKIACHERVTRAVLSGFVNITRGSSNCDAEQNEPAIAAVAEIPAANQTIILQSHATAAVVVKPVGPTPRTSSTSTERVAAAEPVTPAAVCSRVYEYISSARYIAQREASMVRVLAIREKSAMAKATRFR